MVPGPSVASGALGPAQWPQPARQAGRYVPCAFRGVWAIVCCMVLRPSPKRTRRVGNPERVGSCGHVMQWVMWVMWVV
jgi:hypothetical protein